MPSKVKAQETGQPSHWGEIFTEIDVIQELIGAGELKPDCSTAVNGSVIKWYNKHSTRVDPILQPILDATPNPGKEVEDRWVESGVMLGTKAKQKDRLAWMAARYNYSRKDLKQVQAKVHQAGQPWYGWVLQTVMSYKSRTGT